MFIALGVAVFLEDFPEHRPVIFVEGCDVGVTGKDATGVWPCFGRGNEVCALWIQENVLAGSGEGVFGAFFTGENVVVGLVLEFGRVNQRLEMGPEK